MNETKKSTADREKDILKFWLENKIFEKTLAKKSPKGEFVFYDGPPFATGLPHYGHILAGVIKDAIPRWKTMQGFHVRRRWGWDCHGLPLENLIEKELDLKTKKEIEEYGVNRFNEAAKESVLRYADDWREIIPRTGRWVDMDADYRTMDASYTESVWWVFKTLYDKGLIYEGFKPMHLCPRCETTLSNFEVSQGYTEITDLAVTVEFEVKNPEKNGLKENTHLLAWTTTPWTLPGNMALAVHPDIVYAVIEKKDMGDGPLVRFVLSESLLEKTFGKTGYSVIEKKKGNEMVGLEYEPPFPYYRDVELKGKENAWKVYAAPFVSTNEGTGIVHIAPAFGEDDMRLAEEHKIPVVHHVGTDGKFKSEVRDFAGLSVKPKGDHQRTDILIIKELAGKNLLFGKEKITHSYPLCWRCETPLLNYAANSWFVAVTKIKDKLVAANESIRWVPWDIKEGRFGNWLKGARDWAISRSRYWGAPIPVWRNRKTGKILVIGSIEELRKLAKKTKDTAWLFEDGGARDLHRPKIDAIELIDGEETFERVPDVFDCWFESGSMPYGENHYPFENKETFDPARGRGFPADFIAEGLDQTRGWFYSLLVLAVALFGKTAYKNVIVNGLILAEDGRKMSKRLKNYPDPVEVMDKYGADALRFYLLSSPVARGEDINFSEKGVKEMESKVISRALNVLAFYEMYAKDIPGTRYPVPDTKTHILDKWIHARLEETVSMVSLHMERYELDKAVRPLALFIDDLSTWYLRRSRERLKEAHGAGNGAARQTLRFILIELSKAIAPFMPFVAEELYRGAGGVKESVHLEEWLKHISKNSLTRKLSSFFARFSGVADERAILSDMESVRKIVSHGLLARAKAGIRVRQPLKELRIKNNELRIKKNGELIALVKDEVNVKDVIFGAEIEDEVALDTEITPELKKAGQFRELVRAVQELRKQNNLTPDDEAILFARANEEGRAFLQEQRIAIEEATTLSAVEFKDELAGEEVMIDGMAFLLQLRQQSP